MSKITDDALRCADVYDVADTVTGDQFHVIALAAEVRRLMAENQKLHDLLLSASPAMQFSADLCRRIKAVMQVGYRP